MKNEFALAFNEVIDHKQLPREVVMAAIEDAMISAYRKAVNASNAQQVIAKIDPEDGRVLIYAEKEVVDDVHDHRTEVTIGDALEVDPEAEIGGMVIVETTPENFGRVAAQTARQVIQQRMREAEREAQFEHFSTLIGEVINGVVQATNPKQITLGLDKKAEGIMPYKEQIRGERFRVHDRVRALLADVKESPRGPQIILSRSHKNFLRRLLEDEVPEIYHGLVEVRSISREPGQRSKVAVSALQAGIDPVGACVGVRGVRIQAIVRELNDEKIDVIEWNPDPIDYIAKALSPARVVGVFLDKYARGAKTATVVVPEDQLSLAIGRDGQNARLAAKLTGWRIDIKSLPEAAGDSLHRMQTNADYADILEKEVEIIPVVESVLTKKSEGRPVTPEEYQVLSRFVNRVENRAIDQREADKLAELEVQAEIKAIIPAVAFDTPLEDLGISPRFTLLLTGEGLSTVGDLIFQVKFEPDVILAMKGIGPKAMEEIENSVTAYLLAVPVEPELPEVVAEDEISAEDIASEDGEGAPGVEELEGAPTTETAVEEPVDAEVVSEVAEEETSVEEGAEVEPSEAEAAKEEPSLEEIFSTAPAKLGIEEPVSEEDIERLVEEEGKVSKKKKKRFVEMEYDPERDIMIVKRQRKRSGKDWIDALEDDDWE